MIRELKRWVKKLRAKTKKYDYSVPQPVGQVVNTVSSWNYTNNAIYVGDSGTATAMGGMQGAGTALVDTRETKKPVEVVDRIIAEIPAMDLNDLDRQIKIVQRRLDIMEEISGNTRDENIALIFLKARKRYAKFGHLFEKWAVTNQEKIEKLCQAYKVMVVDFSGYSRNVPQEGLDQLELYFEAWSKIVPDKKPVLKLIVDQGGKEQRKDPILLAQSPFGNWFYILGAWDKEVEIVDDLVYHNK